MIEACRKVPDPPEYIPSSEYISEGAIRDFCRPCEMLDVSNMCIGFSDPEYWQPNNAVRRYCDRARVDGVRGVLDGGRFESHEWMKTIVEERNETMSEEAIRLVNEVNPKEIEKTRIIVEREFQEWLKRFVPDPSGIANNPYDAYYGNFFVILPGWRDGGHLTEYLGSDGLLDTPHREIQGVSNNSELYLNQTRRLFTGLIYAAIEAEGLSVEMMYRYQQNRNHKKLAEYAMPVLIRLRAMGYVKADLWH